MSGKLTAFLMDHGTCSRDPLRLLSLMAALLLCACGKFTPEPQSKVIGIIVDCNATKGTPVTTDNITSFNIVGYADDEWHDNTIPDGQSGSITNPNAAGKYFDATAVSGSNATGWSLANERYWLNAVPMTFWSYKLPTTGTVGTPSYVSSSTAKTMSFTYTLPTPSTTTAKADATAQQDMIMALNTGEKRVFYDDGVNYGQIKTGDCTGTRTDSKIDIHFYHALSQVNFIVRTDDDSFDPSHVIKSISLVNVWSGGDCVFKGTETNPEDKFVWTNRTSSSTLKYPLNTYTEDYGSYADSENTRWTDREIGTDEYRMTVQSFFMIPQTLGTTAAVRLTLSDDTDHDVSISGDVWKAGYYYTYKLNSSPAGEPLLFSLTLVDWGIGGTSTYQDLLWQQE